MCRSVLLPFFLLLAGLFIFPSPVFSQTIDYQNPAEFFVCGQAPFQVTVSNTSGAALQGVTVTVEFSSSIGNCGIAYVAGTVAGASESNVSDLTSPVFQLANLPPGSSQMLTFQAETPCATAACIDNAGLFFNEIALNWNGGSTAVTTDPYVVETALLVITAVNSPVMMGTRGDVLQRKITIRNTRPGALAGFIFTDVHQPGISISSAQGTDISSGNTFQLALGSADFSTIGDGDGLFEFNEAITITEDILVTDCGVDITSAASMITAGWGCGGEICQDVFVNAVVTLKPYDKAPELIWEPIVNTSECFCGPDGYQQGMTITNVGDGLATEIVFEMLLPIGSSDRIDQASLVVDSAGVDLTTPVSFAEAGAMQAPCEGPPENATGFILTLPALAPGESVTVFWDYFFCRMQCEQPNVAWVYRYSYFKECPPEIFIEEDDFMLASANGNLMFTELSSDVTSPMQDGDTVTVTYGLEYDSLALIDDEMTVEFWLPCGMTWDDDNELLLGGQAPTDVSLTASGIFSIVTATYQLPLPADSLSVSFDFTWHCGDICFPAPACNDSLATTCTAIDSCSFPPNCFIEIAARTTILKCPGSPPACNFQDCQPLSLAYDCPSDTVIIEEPPGYVNYRFDAYRLNLGLPDNDNDRKPDGPGTPDLSLIRRDRLVTGDTIRATLRGEVVKDVETATLPYGHVRFAFRTNQLGFFNAGSLLSDGTGISLTGTTVRIFDSSSGTYFTCEDPAAIINPNQLLNYTFDLSAAALDGCLPANFTYDDGDSIIVEAGFRIEYNIQPDAVPDPNPLLGFLTLEPSLVVFDADTAFYRPLDCACHARTFEVTGYNLLIQPGLFGLPPCNASGFNGGSVFRLSLDSGNFFPFEHRNLATFSSWQVEMPPTVDLLQTRMTFLRHQGGNDVFTNQILTPVFANGVHTFDLTAFQNPLLDEGFLAFFQYVFESDCENDFSMPLKLTANLDFVSGLGAAEDPLALVSETNALRPLIANLSVESPLVNLVSFSNQLVFDFNFVNFPTEVGSLTSAAAPNTWMYVTSPSGLVTDFQLIDLASGDTLPSVNGVFQLGSYPIDTIPFQFIGTNNSCELEELELHFGWNCGPFASTVQSACNEQMLPLTLLSPPGALDLLVTSPQGCTELCDTIPYHSIQVFNAELGAVYDVTLTALLPPGLTVLPGSSEVEYPAGSGNFFAIGDPLQPVAGTAVWPLTELVDSIAGGLPGVGSAPANALTLRFLSETSCDFIADAYVVFTVAGVQNCGEAANTVAKPGDPICIEGVSDPYSTSIGVDALPGFGCNGEVTFEVAMTATDTLPPGACAIVTLPLGVSLVPGSCASACQPNFNCNPTVEGNTLTWQLPAGVLPNQIVCFNFTTTGWDSLGCSNGVVIFRTAAETQALCTATGDSCSTKVSTGSLVFPFDIQQPEFGLGNFTVNASASGANDLVNFSIDIQNDGAPSEPPLLVQFLLDTDGNGSGDLPVHTGSLVATIANGQSVTMTGSFEIPAGNLCNLLAYIGPELQCACAGDSAAVTFPIIYETGFDTVVCSGQDAVIGVPAVPGFSYQWAPDDCLLDANAATTVFNCVNATGSPLAYGFTLAGSDGSCEIQHLLGVTLQPQPGILFAETPICAGESANLAATDGLTFDWSGPGVVPGQQVQSVTPAATATYSVTVTDAAGCTGTDAVTIVVHPLPVVDAGPDTSFCLGQMASLDATFDPDYQYFWSPAAIGGQPALDNPNIANPLILVSETTTFTLTVEDGNGCENSDAVTVSFFDSLELTLSPDVTICAGTSTVLTAAGADVYEWTPPGDCQDPACASVLVSPNATTTYTVVGMTADGCSDTASVTVTVVTDVILTTGPPVEICEGETAVIFGETLSEPGVYCDTVSLAAGCDSVHCIELLVKNPIDTTLLADTVCQGESVSFQGEMLVETGFYCVTLTGSNDCDSTVCLDLAVLDTPQVLLLVPDTVSVGDTVLLSIEPGAFDSIVWSGGNITGLCTNSPTCVDTLLESAEYSVTVVDENGCAATVLQSVAALLQCDPEMAELPNVFTPNGDGVNDVFTIVAPEAETVLNMRIWNRWGEKVYDGPGPWDGTQDGKPAVSDVYVYLIKVGCPVEVEAEERVLKGDVTLLR